MRRENGSIQTPVDGWKFHVKHNGGRFVCCVIFVYYICPIALTFCKYLYPRLIYRSHDTFEATSRELSRHVVYARLTKQNAHCTAIFKDLRVFNNTWFKSLRASHAVLFNSQFHQFSKSAHGWISRDLPQHPQRW